MFRKIAQAIRYPDWASEDSRYRCLDLRDRLLDGTFYNHLNYAFYDEVKPGTQELIPLTERRPSAQYRLPRMVARWCTRKLFTGRHAPKVRHKDKAKIASMAALLRKGKFFERMAEAVLLGSVGAVAVTFRVETTGGKNPKVALQCWRAKYCQPSFDDMGELAQLRVAYTTSGAALEAMGAPGVEKGQEYWYIRDWLPTGEVTYQPVKKVEWNPVHGFVGEGAANKKLEPWAGEEYKHDLGFVCAHWFVNLGGGLAPDGCCTFEDAIPNSVELDYTLSQIGRGTRYNSAPQLVTIGKVMNGAVTRGPMTHLEMEAGYKDEDGSMVGVGDAKLLEMSGTGTEAALKLIDHLRNMALEQIAASRKDPDKMKAPLSGRAMEYLDQDSDDMVGDLRSQYGEHGALPLIKKIAIASKIDKDAGGFTLQWPRMFQPTPDEVFSLAQAFQIMLDPMKKTAPAQPGSRPASAQGAHVDAVPATEPKPEEQLITFEEAKAYIAQVLDLSMIDMEDAGDEQDAVDDSPTEPDEATPMAPQPTSVDVPVEPGTPADQPESASPAAGPAQVGGMNIGPRTTVNA
jgi:hypothetical protein